MGVARRRQIKRSSLSEAMTKKDRHIFWTKIGWHPLVAAPGNTNPSEATVYKYTTSDFCDCCCQRYSQNKGIGANKHWFVFNRLQSCTQRAFDQQFTLIMSETLTHFHLDSLELRRLRSDLCMMYKIVFGLCDVDTDNLYVLRLDVSRPTRGHRFKIMLEHCTNNYRKNFFIQRVAPVWNSLLLAIVDFSSLLRFQRSLAMVNLRIFTCF